MLKTFKSKLLSWLLGLIVGIYGIVHFTYVNTNIVLAIFCALITIAMAVGLYALVSKTNKVISDFLENIKYEDYSATYSVSRENDASFNDLYGSFNTITNKFRDIRSEKEAQFQYLQAIVGQMETGLICFNSKGETILMNRFLQRILHKSYFPSMATVGKSMPRLLDAMETVEPSERKLVKLLVENQILQLSIRKTILKMQEDDWTLFSIHNIHAELDEKEMQSWQKLIRILTHEIMNSVTPVTSLAASTGDMLDATEHLDEDDIEDVRAAVKAIRKRSEGLLHFTETYKRLTKIPAPIFKTVNAHEFIEDITVLLKTELETKGIELKQILPKHQIEMQADVDLLHQVFINLLKNAMEAVQENEVGNRQITFSLAPDPEQVAKFTIADNGSGIPDDKIDQIFIPFFTTKREGSGIGLSLSRQIVHMHKGSISVFYEKDKGTVFVVRL